MKHTNKQICRRRTRHCGMFVRFRGLSGRNDDEQGTVEFLFVEGFVQKNRENEQQFHSALFVGRPPCAPSSAPGLLFAFEENTILT